MDNKKKKIDKSKLFARIMCILLAVLMVGGGAITLIMQLAYM